MPPEPSWPTIVLELILIFVSAFFVAAQTAVLALSENKLRKQIEEGNTKLEHLVKTVSDPSKFASATQFCIMLCRSVIIALAIVRFYPDLSARLAFQSLFSQSSQSFINAVAVLIIVLCAFFATFIFGELIPKRAALHAPEKAAFVTGTFARSFTILFRPLIWLCSVIATFVLRVFGVRHSSDPEQVSEDEILMMVDIGEESGAIESGEKEMIENIFEFNNTSADDVMIHRTDIEFLWVDAEFEQILGTIKETGLSRFPVCEDDVDDIIGILSTRDWLLNAQLENPKPLKELLRPAYFVPETVRTDVLFRDMQSKKTHMAIVVDEYGGTSGLVTMEDLLEEIVGNIYDEFDPQDEQLITPISDNLWRISGSAELDTVAEALNIELPENEEYGTLGGLIFSCLSAIPEDGSHPEVSALGLNIKVDEMSDRRVEWALVSKTVPETTDEE